MSGKKLKNESNALTHQVCIKCKKKKSLKSDFYKSNSDLYTETGSYPVCKQCITERIPREADPLSIHYLEIIKSVLLELNKPYIYSLWLSSIEESKKRSWSAFNCYMKNINLPQNRDLTWKHSDYELTENKSSERDNSNDSVVSAVADRDSFIITDELVDKWGLGYSVDEYRSFERKYNLLKNNYQEKTAMHTEALLTYVRYRVKEELATAINDSKAAKEWGVLAKDAATAAKINPSQLSKSDLSDGLDTFGQLVRTVEQAVDIIPILPQFKARPQDSVDFTIWCYVNYIRDLKGLPPAEYSEIYKFYEERKKEYESRTQEFEEGVV